MEKLYQIFQQSTGVSTDTRTLKTGNVFFALKGSNFDGNQYALKALESGAQYVVVDDPDVVEDDRFLLVQDCLLALQQLARHHRRTFSIPVIGITGSNGKTTTKELLTSVLSKNISSSCDQRKPQ